MLCQALCSPKYFYNFFNYECIGSIEVLKGGKTAKPAHRIAAPIGQVPEGFEQVIPPPSESFCITPRKEYVIAILTDVKSVFPLGKTWIAE